MLGELSNAPSSHRTTECHRTRNTLRTSAITCHRGQVKTFIVLLLAIITPSIYSSTRHIRSITKNIHSTITQSPRDVLHKCYASVKHNDGQNGFYYGLCDNLLQQHSKSSSPSEEGPCKKVMIRQTAESLSGHMAQGPEEYDAAASYTPPRLPPPPEQLRAALSMIKARNRVDNNSIRNASTKERDGVKEREMRLGINLPFQIPVTRGFYYYGIDGDNIFQRPTEPPTAPEKQTVPSPSGLEEIEDPNKLIEEMTKSLSEFRSMTDELRRSLIAMEKQMSHLSQSIHLQKALAGIDDDDDGSELYNDDGTSALPVDAARRRRALQFESVASDVEQWANGLFGETEEDGWEEVKCSKLLRGRYTNHDSVKCYLKWIPDARRRADDDEEKGRKTCFPCIKVLATIDAPLEKVTRYLSNPDTIPEYNDLVVEHEDVEQISHHSKITWGKCPQILFIKPRDFVTFCHLKWKNNGKTQVVLNQAVDHDDRPGVAEEGVSPCCRAYALRGANVISQAKGNKNQTTFQLLAQADPGGGLPAWAVKTAINTLVPIEPFKLMHRIEKGANSVTIPDETAGDVQTTFVSNMEGLSGVGIRGGLSQLGYACFWPGRTEAKESQVVAQTETD
mmetsp:Transcript_61253/g.72722  ORF Transcript_61253/g.72722 Transcript_61253/m.72722 type:complete len:620 (+) Transcript_61253:169-2028(+)